MDLRQEVGVLAYEGHVLPGRFRPDSRMSDTWEELGVKVLCRKSRIFGKDGHLTGQFARRDDEESMCWSHSSRACSAMMDRRCHVTEDRVISLEDATSHVTGS